MTKFINLRGARLAPIHLGSVFLSKQDNLCSTSYYSPLEYPCSTSYYSPLEILLLYECSASSLRVILQSHKGASYESLLFEKGENFHSTSHLLESRTRTSWHQRAQDLFLGPSLDKPGHLYLSSFPTHTRHPFMGERIGKPRVRAVPWRGTHPETTTETLWPCTEQRMLFLSLYPTLQRRCPRTTLRGEKYSHSTRHEQNALKENTIDKHSCERHNKFNLCIRASDKHNKVSKW